MPTREQVLALLEQGHSYETAARTLHVPPGQVFMVATGLPADGSDAPSEEELARRRIPPGSTQSLVNPPPFNPTRKEHVLRWARERAHRDLTPDGE